MVLLTEVTSEHQVTTTVLRAVDDDGAVHYSAEALWTPLVYRLFADAHLKRLVRAVVLRSARWHIG